MGTILRRRGRGSGSATYYAVIEEHSNKTVDPLSYDEAVKIADRRNAAKAVRVREAVARST